MATSSALFTPYRTIGLVCGGEQQHLYNLGSATFMTTSIGKAFQVYNTDHLSLVMVSRPIAHEITHVVCKKETTFAATEVGIYVFRRSRPLRVLTWNGSKAGAASHQPGQVLQLLCLGDVLVSLHFEEGRNLLRMWDTTIAESGDGDALVTTVGLPSGHSATTFMHPDTYLNKLAIGTDNGSVLIVNIRTGKLVYDCKVKPGVAVRSLAQSDAADVVGVGFADGSIFIHNLLSDSTICTFAHSKADSSAVGAVTGLAFSFDNTLLHATLVSVTDLGAIALWNLDDGVLQYVLPAAHGAAVTLAGFLPRQPCLITAGADNAVHVWIVDKLDGTLKPLRARSGHQAPPRMIRYYGGASVASLASGANASACEIVSAGADRCLRMFHTGLDRQNCELSQGSLKARARALGVNPNLLRLPPITALAASDRQHGHWSDVVTAHAGESKAYIWSWENKRLEDRVLQLKSTDEVVTALCISSCGHFAVLGGSRGTVCKFNLQSAARRGCFPKAEGDDKMVARGKKRKSAHDGTIGEPERDVGKGTGPGHWLSKHDSIDTSLFKVMGMKPRAVLAKEGLLPAAVPAHTSMITGVAVDAFNAQLVSSDVQGTVHFWDFSTHSLKGSVKLASPAAFIVLHKDSNLLAAACDDFAVRVIDLATRRIVRTFGGHTNRLTDVTFSPDGRWLVTASLDRSVRVWDLPSTKCIDWLHFEDAVTSLTFSPTNEYLVTSHVDSNGLCLWANKAHFSTLLTDLAPSKPYEMDMPGAETEEGDVEVDDAARAAKRPRAEPTKTADVDDIDSTLKLEAKDDCRVTLSRAPLSQWQNLTKLDIIAARNKPKEPPKKPEAAPFFLPTTGGLNPTFVGPAKLAEPEAASEAAWTAVWDDKDDDDAPRAITDDSKPSAAKGRIITTSGKREAQTVLAQLLRGTAAIDEQNHADVCDHLSTLPPAAVDVEFRSLCLGPEDSDGLDLLRKLFAYFAHQVERGEQFELTQAQLQLTLKLYEPIIIKDDELSALAARLQSTTKEDVARLRKMLDKSLCMISLFLGQ